MIIYDINDNNINDNNEILFYLKCIFFFKKKRLKIVLNN